MDLKDTKIIKAMQIFIARKDKETAIKKRQEKVNAIVKGLLVDKTPSQAISMMREVTELFNSKLDDKLKESLDDVNSISAYKKLKK